VRLTTQKRSVKHSPRARIPRVCLNSVLFALIRPHVFHAYGHKLGNRSAIRSQPTLPFARRTAFLCVFSMVLNWSVFVLMTVSRTAQPFRQGKSRANMAHQMYNTPHTVWLKTWASKTLSTFLCRLS